jgi:methyl-accepting chemotaxis protein
VNQMGVTFTILAVAILIQGGILAGVLITLRHLSGNIERLHTYAEKEVSPLLSEMKEIATCAKEILDSSRGTAANFRSISETVKLQVERVNATIEDTTNRARDQIARVDEVVSDAILRLEATSAIIQQNILTPVREVSALIRGVSSGLQFLFTSRKNPVNEAHQDEELFI